MVCAVGCSSLVDSTSFKWSDLIVRRQLGVLPHSSFLDYSSIRAPHFRITKRRKKNRSLVVVDEQSANEDVNFNDVKQQILDYFTYKAVRTVLNQLYELNPPQYRWFYHYVSSNEHGYGKTFIRGLVKDNQELAERVMITRLDLYKRWAKLCDHTKMYERISDQNLELMRERLMETVVFLPDDTNTEVAG